ncbi:MAG: hypothetical protein JKY67_22860 [Pseudomonadales bacterium]|nr:hypothetical protein [Pseudomonadales bacterium]
MLRTIYTIIRPLVRLLLRHGVPYNTFASVSRQVYIDVAEEEFKLEGRKQSLSRISVLTGINRKDIAKIKKLQSHSMVEAQANNRASKVINGWLRDDEFLTPTGKPKKLSLDGKGASFTELVRRYSGDVPVKALLDELSRINAVNVTEKKKISLVVDAYIPVENIEEQMRIMSRATADLLNTIDHNLAPNDGPLRLQRTVAYTNIPVECLTKIRELSHEQGIAFLLQSNKWLSEFDRDNNEKLAGSGQARAGIGIYYFEEIEDNDDA